MDDQLNQSESTLVWPVSVVCAIVSIVGGGLAAERFSASVSVMGLSTLVMIGVTLPASAAAMVRSIRHRAWVAVLLQNTTLPFATMFLVVLWTEGVVHPLLLQHKLSLLGAGGLDGLLSLISVIAMFVFFVRADGLSVAGGERQTSETAAAAPEQRRAALLMLVGQVSIGICIALINWAVFVFVLSLGKRLGATAVQVLALLASLGVWWLVTPLYLMFLVLFREPPSHEVAEAIGDTQSRAAFNFRRVVYVGGGLGALPLCAVTRVLRNDVLILGRAAGESLSRQELVAVLCHEAAHVRFRHVRKRRVFLMLGLVTAMTTTYAVWRTMPGLWRSGWVPLIVISGLCMIPRGLYEAFVIRRQEREADIFAAKVAGSRPLADALLKLWPGATGVMAPSHIWSSHGSREQRLSVIRSVSDR